MIDLAEIAKGLLTIEINTIQKDGMSGQKMPTAPNAMVDIVENYWDHLCQRASRLGPPDKPLSGWMLLMAKDTRVGLSPFPDKDGDPPNFPATAPSSVDVHGLGMLRDVAAWMIEVHARITAVAEGGERFSSLAQSLRDYRSEIVAFASRIGPEERAVLYRIQRNCDQFKCLGVFTAPGDPKVIVRADPERDYAPAELVQIRKAWDLGTEVILMQTVIQLDGDVIQRFEPGVDKASRATLHALHASAVDLSFRYWKSLIDVVGGLAQGAIGTFLPR